MGRALRRILPAALPIASWLLAVGLAGCAETRPIDAAGHLRELYAERRAASGAAGVDPAALRVPFELDDELEARLDAELPPGRKASERVAAILRFIFRDLDLRYALTPTRDAAGTFRAREGNCLSFAHLFVAVARHQGLDPFYLEVDDLHSWRQRRGTVVSQGHVVAGLYVDGELRTFDFLPYRPKSYRELRIIDDPRATAHHYNNLGAEALLAGDPERAEGLLRTARVLAPDFAEAINNLGVSVSRQGRTDEAVELYRRGLEQHPDDPALLGNLAAAYRRQGGRETEATALEARLEELRETSPFFFLYRGERALDHGEPGRALELMIEALRRGSELPEVHLGLVKVHLALGDLRRARHHLRRALELDAENDEARRYAALLEDRG